MSTSPSGSPTAVEIAHRLDKLKHRAIVSNSKNASDCERTIARLRPTLDLIDRDLLTFDCDAEERRELESLLAQFKDEILADSFSLRTSRSAEPAGLVPERAEFQPPLPALIEFPDHVVTPTPKRPTAPGSKPR